ncbi:MFS transporter [Pseudonocardia sp. Cha107L01]|uniref:MFS transporter n=1 Tax=Pseudonocardia sp. Cha107L01 TaxID=3457576 RepID=UPI00403E5686
MTGRLTRPQRAWCVYDWANSVFKVSVLTVFFSLYLTDVATQDARAGGQPCRSALRDCAVSMFGVSVQAGSVFGFLLAGSTVLQVFVLPITGAIADRARNKRALLGWFAMAGAAATCGLAVVSGTSWRLGAVLFALANLCYYASVVVYYAYLPEIATPDQRDGVSSKGWAFGYLGGGLCLAINIALIQARALFGLSESGAIRVCFVICGLWWAAFTVIPLRLLPERGEAAAVPEPGGTQLAAGFRQLARTLADARRYPITLAFLAGFLVYIDGVNTVNATAGLYGAQELRLPVEVLTVTILAVQFVAFGGGLAHGWLAARIGAKRTLLISLALWTVVIAGAYFVQAGQRLQFFAVALGIGLVIAGPAALSRSLFSQLVPKGRAAEYFALYTLGERGTSSLGPLVFALVANATGSFRPAILSLIGFLVIGFVIVAAVPLRRGIRDVGNPEPRLV